MEKKIIMEMIGIVESYLNDISAETADILEAIIEEMAKKIA